MTTHKKVIVRKKDEDKENLPESRTEKVDKANKGEKDKKMTASNHSSEREDKGVNRQRQKHKTFPRIEGPAFSEGKNPRSTQSNK